MAWIPVEYGAPGSLRREFHQISTHFFARSDAERLLALCVNPLWWPGQLRGESAMPIKAGQLSSDGAASEGIMADISLGVTVTSLYTLVGLGIVLAFM
jgi:hypothetical protein